MAEAALLTEQRTAHRASAYLTAAAVCATLYLFCLSQSVEVLHWFAVPVFLCGVLIGADAVDWVRNRRDLFDPVGIIGLLGLHLFFLAPLLHVVWDHWMPFVQHPPERRHWLGLMACLNVVGLAAYRGLVPVVEARVASRPVAKVWHVAHDRALWVLGAAMVVAVATQAFVYARFGGITGYVEEYERGAGAFGGLGRLFMIGESFPILAMFAYAVWVRTARRSPAWGEIITVLVLLLAAKLLFGGLRGSRSNIVWALFWGVGIIHLWVRPVSRHLVVGGLVGLITFMYAYGFYKAGGRKTLVEAAEGGVARERIAQTRNRSVQTAILMDLARANGQAYLLYRLMRPDADYDYAWGRTYVGAAALIIPRTLWPDRPETKRMEGTNLMYGKGTFTPGRFVASNVYGVAGEAMMNFGPAAVPFSFVPVAALAGWCAALFRRLDPRDLRWLLVPMLVNLCFAFVVGDSDNIVVFLFTYAAIPYFTLLACSRHVVRRPAEGDLPVSGGATNNMRSPAVLAAASRQHARTGRGRRRGQLAVADGAAAAGTDTPNDAARTGSGAAAAGEGTSHGSGSGTAARLEVQPFPPRHGPYWGAEPRGRPQ